jgi:hypothetical protein
MSGSSLASFATLDGGDDGKEVQTCGAGTYTGADDDAQGTCWLKDSAAREVERAKVPLGQATGTSITELQRQLGFSRPMI